MTSTSSKRRMIGITPSTDSIVILKLYILLSLVINPSSFPLHSTMEVHAFQMSPLSFSSSSIMRKRKSIGFLLARPPPTANFDLDAIEAFEQELDAQQSASLEKDTKEENTMDGEKEEGVIIHIVPRELHNSRIDAALSLLLEPSMSRSRCGSLVANGHISILENKNKSAKPMVVTRKSHKVEAGTEIHLKQNYNAGDNEKPTKVIPEDIPLNILYEDEHIIVLNKSAGMVVHPAAGNWKGTVVNALAHYLTKVSPYGAGEFLCLDGEEENVNSSGNNDETMTLDQEEKDEIEVEGTDGEESASFLRPGIVHRLDKGTTGVLIVAKTKQALSTLSKAFADRTVKKTYIAITVGNPGKNVVIDKPIGRHPVHRQRMRVVPDHRTENNARRRSGRVSTNRNNMSLSQTGRRALSLVDTLAFDGKLSVVQVRIETGRTHQIRVHLQDRRTPIYGDDVYGLPDWNKQLSKTRNVNRPLLHAHRLEVDHPVTGERMILTAPLAEDMMSTADTIWPEGRVEQPHLFQ